MNQYGSKWIELSFKVKCSPLGEKVADLLSDCFAGIYHIDETSLKKVDWTNTHFISINLSHRSLSTTDSAELTWLVVLCHDRCLRMSIKAKTMNYLELTFHQRQREGDLGERHPTIEQHIECIRKYFPLEPTDM